ncbi:hypothetical protein ACS0TY_002857 [Phlomoides rotata]
MGLLLLLKFALVCIDYLAWPVVALGYPLFASIRAVENDSKYHMKKLIIYWTLFSLISLFEFTFLKFIVWIPFWDSLRLIAIIWLVMPRFQGACHAYQILVRPVLSMDLRALIDKFYKTDEDKHLIATKQECSKTERDVLVLEPEEKNDVATSKQVQYAETTPPDSSDRPPDIPPTKNPPQEWTCEICKVTTTSETTLNAHLQGSKHRSNCESLKRSKFHAEETRSSSSSDRPPEIPPIKNSRQEWACDICKVTTTSKTNLNAHLQGSKHRSNCESLKESKFHAGDTRPSTSRSDQGSWLKQAKPKQDGETNQIFELYCNVCSLKLNTCGSLTSHIKGKRHLSSMTTMKQDAGTNQILKLYCNVCSLKLKNSIDLASHVKGKRHLSNIAEISSTN